ncbi:MAG: hypothetical protein NWF01_05795 [Candidatus Bathyarchaeota archaeon]|nr:hypothetical protein [Candidatus Bathyarchaeota archaeon]
MGSKVRRGILAVIVVVLVIVIGVSVVLLSQGASQRGIFQSMPNGSVFIKLTDEGTGKPIGKVDSGYVHVVLGGVDRGYLNDEGELKIDDIEPGSQELMLVIPHYGEKRQFVTVESGQTVPASIVVDMPNPVFDVSINCKTSWFFDEYGEITVTLTNRGDVPSVCTSVLLLVYTDDDTSTPIATHMIDFPSLVPRQDGGASQTSDTWKCSAFKYGPKELITAVVFDGWAYTPQNEQVVSSISSSNSIFTDLSYSVANYLKNHPDLMVNTVSKIVIGWMG